VEIRVLVGYSAKQPSSAYTNNQQGREYGSKFTSYFYPDILAIIDLSRTF